MVSNPAPYLPVRTGRVPEYRACWEELLGGRVLEYRGI